MPLTSTAEINTITQLGEAEATRPNARKKMIMVESVGGGIRTRYLCLAEAAEYLNVSERFMRRAVSDRRVRFYKVGKFLRFDSLDLDALAEATEVGAGASDLADAVWFSARRLG